MSRKRSRRTFIKGSLAAGLGLGLWRSVHAAESRSRRPNIVFVFADQLRSQEVGCYGNRRIHTPNIDRLAAEGVRFQNAVSTYPLCSPFRAMLLTGRQPMANGIMTNDQPLRAGMPSLAAACKSAGYHSGYIGKWHIDGRGRTAYIPPERRLSFDTWMVLECTHDYFKSQYYEGNSAEPRFWKGYDAVAQTAAASEYIRQRAAAGPFALVVSWGPPHNPYVAPEQYMKRFDAAKMELRENVKDRKTGQDLLASSRFIVPEKLEAQRRNMQKQLNNEQNFRRWYAGYYAATEAIDDCVGQIRRALEEARILDNTVFVFTSDHGDMMGSHCLMDKTVPFEEAVSIPFVARYPAKIPAGTVTDALLGPVDMMPTVLSLAGMPCPAVDGMDLSNVMVGATGPQRDAIMVMTMTCALNSWVASGIEPWRAVRTKRHTYARLADGKPWLLFDNQADPQQLDNRVNQADTADLQRQLDKRLDDLLREAGDPVDVRVIDDIILKENPGNAMVRDFRKANPGKA